METPNNEVNRLRAALADIADPMVELRRSAEATGGRLNGYALTLCQDANWLRDKARKALANG